MKKTILIAALGLIGVVSPVQELLAQVAGSTTLGVSMSEAPQVAMGWSAKKSLIGKNLFNHEGDKLGKVEDLIISPNKSVSYVIVGVGGFLGMGRHDVAIPVAQIQDQGGKLVMPGATKEIVKAMPSFEYAKDALKRDQFIGKADEELARAKTKLAELQKNAGQTTGEAKVKLDAAIVDLQQSIKGMEDKLSEMKKAAVERWKEFQAGVDAATTRLKKAMDKATA